MEPTEEQKLRAQEREQGRGDRWEQRTRDGDVENAIRNDKGIVVRDEHTVYLKEEEEDDNNRSFVLELSTAAKEGDAQDDTEEVANEVSKGSIPTNLVLYGCAKPDLNNSLPSFSDPRYPPSLTQSPQRLKTRQSKTGQNLSNSIYQQHHSNSSQGQ